MTENGGVRHDTIAERLMGAARVIALIAFGLLPVICIPYVVAAPLAHTKILIAVLGSFLSLILFAFATLRQGSISYRIELPIVALWGTFGAALTSSLFAGDFLDSFWGSEIGSHTAVFIGVLALTATLWSLIGKNKETVVRVYLLLTASAFLLSIFHISRLIFGVEFLTLGIFGSSNVLSPFSEWNSLAVFFGLVVILSLVSLEQLSLRTWGRALFAAAIGVSLLMLAVINFIAVFIVLGLVSLVTVIYTLTRGRFREGAMPLRAASPVSIGMSLVTFLVSVIFVIGGSTIGAWVSGITGISYIEVRPSLEATFSVAKQVYADHAFLGIGTNRFADAWRMHRDQAINSTVFWNTDFQAGYGFIPTVFVTQGLVGGVLWLVFLGTFLYGGLRTLTRAQDSDRVWYFVALSSFVASMYLWGMTLLYVPGPALMLIAALMTGIFLAARRALQPQTEHTFELMRNQRFAFMTVSVTVLIVVASVGAMYYTGRHYAATYVYRDSLVSLSEGVSADQVVARIAAAFELSADDLYARQVASYERERMMAFLSAPEATEEVRVRFQQSLESGIQAALLATSIDGTDPETWSMLGRVYAVVVPLKIEGAYDRAKEALERARTLDPKNPARVLALAELELLNNNADAARTHIQSAIALKSNYTDAMYVLAQLEIAQGNVQAAIDSTRATTMLDPQNPVRYFQLGVLELSADKSADAIRSFERAIAISPDYSNARYFLAFAYDAQGRGDDARRELDEVLARNPGNVEVESLITKLKNGESLNQTVASTAEPIVERSEQTTEDGTVTTGQAPDSSLLSPVNTDTVSSDSE